MINLTPHAIIIRTSNGDAIFPPSGTVARVETIETVIGTVDGIEIVSRTFGNVIGLPDNTDEMILVSAMVLSAIPNRPNTFAPDSGNTAIRNDKGHIVAVTRLVAA